MDILQQTKQGLSEIDGKIKEAERLLTVLKAAGEKPDELENNLRELKKRKTKWEDALKQAGY